MRSLELRIPPVALVIIFGAGMAAIAYAIPTPLTIPVNTAVAIVLAVMGALVALAGVVAFRRHKTTVNPLSPEQSTSLVATGVYRFSRNPMYLGFLLVLIGWCIYLASWTSALMLPAFIAYMNRFQIQPEERALANKFGLQFSSYSSSVRRWL